MRNAIKYILWLLSVFMLISCDTKTYHRNWAPSFNRGTWDPFSTGEMYRVLNNYTSKWNAEYVNLEETYNGRIISEFKRYDMGRDGRDTFWFSQSNNLLWVEYSKKPLDMAPHDVDSLWARNEDGRSTIIACDNFGELITSKPHPFIIEDFANEVNSNKKCNISVIKNLVADTIYDEDDNKCIIDTIYNFPTQMCQSRIFHNPNSEFLNRYAKHRVLATIDSEPIAIQYIHENGSSLIFVSTPLLFTNYGLFYEKNAKLIFKFLQLAKDVDWNLLYRSSENQTSALYVANPPKIKAEGNTANDTDWAKRWLDRLITYSVIALFIGFLMFLARRRERIIPVIKKPENRTINFAKQMGRNYMWKGEYQTMVKKKFVVFISQLQDEMNINLNDTNSLNTNIETLEKLTGEKDLKELINELFLILNDEVTGMNFTEMKYYIDKLNVITSKLK